MDYHRICFIALVCLLVIKKTDCKRFPRRFIVGKKRPNIIFVMTDDLDSALNSPSVMTKTKRLLQDQGVTFQNAFTTAPLCCPSRSSILTGRYPHNHNVQSNNKNCYGVEWRNGAERENFGKLMKDAGYETGYFGKYLNNYDGVQIPNGWNHWFGLLKNSRFYNYTINENGKFIRYGNKYPKDYFTDVITSAGINYFKRKTRSINSPPVMMVLSYSAPHGPEDGAPPYQKRFRNVKAPRFPTFNASSPDKHWIIRVMPPITKVQEKFIDTLYRKRLQTLLSVDDAIERIYMMLLKTRQLSNTYIVFSSDHGYHLGQFRQVKGKAQPYEADIRIPLYIRGPKVPQGITVSEIALNIDFAPTFLDIARSRAPKFIDGTSFMDVAVKNVMNRRKGKIIQPIWKDTFLVSRGKLKPPNGNNRTNIAPMDFPSVRKIQKLCARHGYPRPPCTPGKSFVCSKSGNSWYLQRCLKNDRRKSVVCTCPKKQATLEPSTIDMSINSTNNEIKHVLSQLERQFERLKRRIKRHGLRYINKFAAPKQNRGFSVIANRGNVREPNTKARLEGNKQQKFSNRGSLVERKIWKSQKRLQYWQQERSKLAMNRELTKKLTLKLANRLGVNTRKKDNYRPPCYCNRLKQKQSKEQLKYRGSKKKKNKNKILNKPKAMNCFQMHSNHWKTPPLWKDESFVACTNSPNNSFWCARTINDTHNFLYCEFSTGFHEYFDMIKDPYQMRNIYPSLSTNVKDNLRRIVQHLRLCVGARDCFVKAGETLSDRRDVLRKLRRYERKKRNGFFYEI